MKILHYITILAFKITVAASAQLPNINTVPKIIGGHVCKIEKYPFIVSIINSDLCGGTVLTMSWILTAAHCFPEKPPDVKDTMVRGGFTSSAEYIQTREVAKIVIHKQFDIQKLNTGEDLRFDIALVMVKAPFDSSKVLQLAKLPNKNFTSSCTVAKAFGIGITKASDASSEPTVEEVIRRNLLCVDLHIAPMESCYHNFPLSVIDDSVLMTSVGKSGGDACQGDSGGPLVCQGVVIGIISTGTVCGAKGGCGSYTKVESYLDFIKSEMDKNPVIRQEKSQSNLVFTHQWKRYLVILLAINIL